MKMIFVLSILALVLLPASLSAQSDELPDAHQTRSSVHKAEPKSITKVIRTFSVDCLTELIARDHMLQALRNQPDFGRLDMVLVDNPRLADVRVIVNYVPFTFDYTFKVVEPSTTVVIAAGRVTEFNGYFAAPALAKKIVEQIKQVKEHREQEVKPVK